MEVNAVMWYYGVSKTKAKEIIKTSTTEKIRLIVEAFTNNARRSFYED